MLRKAPCFRPPHTAYRGASQLTVRQLRENGRIDEAVVLKGWIRTVRHQKPVSFVEVNDGSCLGNMQVITSPEEAERYIRH
jgi:aspartyl/asparaginyl-tRNA synthetase